jgi:outer membrane receptor protein involved in Fe transport
MLGICMMITMTSRVWATDADTDAMISNDALSLEVIAQRPRANDDVISPLTIVEGDALANSGTTTIDEYLQRLPMFGSQGVNQSQNDGGYGASFLDLRNLNFNRTLVLIDGRRVVLSGIKTDEAVDVANIPAALVERIEIMPNGSNPAYGADAVAGVVNIVLKRDLTDFVWHVGSGISTDGDGAGGDLSAAYGVNWGRGNLTVSTSWSRTEPIPQSARTWARDPLDSASFAPTGALVLTRGSAATLAGHPVFAGAASSPIEDGYDTSSAAYLRGGLERATFNLMSHEALAESVTLLTDVSLSNKVSSTELPPLMLGLYGTAKHPDGFVIPADNPFNPYNQDVTLQRVLAEVGDMQTRSDSQIVRVVTALEGTLVSDTKWSLSFNHGESRTTYRTDNAVNLTRALQSVSTDPASCPVNQGCLPADYFGAGSLTPAAADYIRYTDATHSEYQESEIQGTLERAVPMPLDAPWNVKLGAEYRHEFGETTPSAVVLAGDQAGPDSAPTSGGYASREAFITLAAPLLRNRELTRTLSVDASARHASTSLFGDFTTWQTNAAWAPVDAVRFRVGIGTARRVPAITEAFGGITATALEITDPCDGVNGLLSNATVAANCRAIGLSPAFRQASALISVDNGGNPQLRPEASRNLNAGIQMNPRIMSNLSIDADYYRIHVHNAIDSLSDYNPNYIPDTCFTSVALSSPLCRMITRTPSGPSAGQISQIEAPDQNIGAIDTDGIDVAMHYRIGVGASSLRLDAYASWLQDYRVQETPTSAFIQEAGTFPNVASAGSLTRLRGFFAATYDTGRWIAAWNARYIGPATVLGQDPSSPFASAPGIFYHDLSAGFKSQGIEIEVGIDNVANQKPPTLIDGVTNTNTNTYDVVGRYVYLRTSGKW